MKTKGALSILEVLSGAGGRPRPTRARLRCGIRQQPGVASLGFSQALEEVGGTQGVHPRRQARRLYLRIASSAAVTARRR